MSQESKKAVIYCRVSSAAQMQRGHGIESQETICREYARSRGLYVEQVFKDEGVSGSVLDRPAMKAMLKHLRRNKKDDTVVIIYDITRLARGISTHLALRTKIIEAGATLESPTMEFGEDSDSILVENLLASVSQHQRQKNAEQVSSRMRARVMNGYWVFSPPIGYRYEARPGQGNVLVRDEPNASIVQEALQGFASGRFRSAAEVQRFLAAHPSISKNAKGKATYKRGDEILNRVIYSGYLTFEKWDIHLVPGRHEALISYEEFERIQERLNGNKFVPIRKDVHEDFPLRGHVACSSCGNPMTAAWSKGRSTYYPYYFCHQKGCAMRGKSIQRDQVEGDFEAFLKELRPAATLYNVLRDMLSDAWEDRKAALKERAKGGTADLRRIEKKIEAVMTRITQIDSPAVISAYENEIKKLEANRVLVAECVELARKPLSSFEQTFRTALGFIANPWNLWSSGNASLRKLVLRLVFPMPVPYCRNQGFRTAATPLPFRVFSGSDTPD
ncbi:MAG: recombinase family protein [Paracoccaceae bacterium]